MEPSGAARGDRVAAPRASARRALWARRCTRVGAVALMALAGTACATKRDIRDLREQLAAMQARQDSLYRVIAQQNRALMDSVRQTHEMVLRADLLVMDRGTAGGRVCRVWQGKETVGTVSLQSLAAGVVPNRLEAGLRKFFTQFRTAYTAATRTGG